MHKIWLFLIFFVFVTTTVFAQETLRRDCSFVGRPIIDILGGVIIGKALKLSSPRLSRIAKKAAKNTIVKVEIEVDENGRVVFAEAFSVNSVLRKSLEQAARQTKFSPSQVDGEPIKIKGQITYTFDNNKPRISYDFEPIQYSPKSVDVDQLNLRRTFDSKIISVIKDFQEGKNIPNSNFVRDGRANIQICLATKNPKILQNITEIGFELVEETQGNGLVGNIDIKNLRKLADIEAVRFIVPEIQ